MKRVIFLLLVIISLISGCSDNKEVNIELKYDQNISLEYDEVISAYQQLADAYSVASLTIVGKTDIGKPLHLFMISKDGDFDPASIRKKGRTIVFINNGIHPGEPEGIDASMQFSWDLLSGKNDLEKYLDNTVIAIIPVYNIGGALDRSKYYRMNQDGPIYKGRRRNAKNIDLNRDFAKQETSNAQSFAKIFTYLNPDVFLDTHTTNGSDHQYTLTLIATLHSKLEGEMGSYFKDTMLPALYKGMEENSEYGMIPYVATMGFGDIKNGIVSYNDHPYYSTGYTSLFNCYSFMTENLVYKYFPDRVRSVVDFLTQLVKFTSENNVEIRRTKDEADELVKNKELFHLAWKLDTDFREKLYFRGYEYVRDNNGPNRGRRSGHYDHQQPWEDTIPYYTKYDPLLSVRKPYAYIVPQAWDEIIQKFSNNGIESYRLSKDISIEVECYYIDQVKASSRATQGHKINTGVEVHSIIQNMQYYKGDYVVMVNQHANKYIVEMLEPHAPNSFFAWNYFDPILESHDFYSIWGFESHLYELLDDDKDLQALLNEKKVGNPEFAADPIAQLQFLYENTDASEIEKWNRLYPVTRLLNEADLPVSKQANERI